MEPPRGDPQAGAASLTSNPNMRLYRELLTASLQDWRVNFEHGAQHVAPFWDLVGSPSEVEVEVRPSPFFWPALPAASPGSPAGPIHSESCSLSRSLHNALTACRHDTTCRRPFRSAHCSYG